MEADIEHLPQLLSLIFSVRVPILNLALTAISTRLAGHHLPGILHLSPPRARVIVLGTNAHTSRHSHTWHLHSNVVRYG